MKLFLVSRTDEIDYDEWDSFVCAAENEDSARNTGGGELCEASINKYDRSLEWNNADGYNYQWIDRENISSLNVKYIGETDQYKEKTIIIVSFNAA